MKPLLNKVISIPEMTYPRPQSALDLEHAINLKRDARLRLTQQKWEAYMDKLAEARMNRLINKLAKEEE